MRKHYEAGVLKITARRRQSTRGPHRSQFRSSCQSQRHECPSLRTGRTVGNTHPFCFQPGDQDELNLREHHAHVTHLRGQTRRKRSNWPKFDSIINNMQSPHSSVCMHERESLCDPRAIRESAHNRLGNGFIQCRLFDRQLFHCEAPSAFSACYSPGTPSTPST